MLLFLFMLHLLGLNATYFVQSFHEYNTAKYEYGVLYGCVSWGRKS